MKYLSRIGSITTAVIAFALITVHPAKATAEPRSCKMVYDLGNELGCSFSKIDQNSVCTGGNNSLTNNNNNDRDFFVMSTFGPTQCKTQDLARDASKSQKTECANWLKERKSDLGSKYLTGTCNDDCEDCNMGLKRCSVHGIVHYNKDLK